MKLIPLQGEPDCEVESGTRPALTKQNAVYQGFYEKDGERYFERVENPNTKSVRWYELVSEDDE